MPSPVTERTCPKCAELWDTYAVASRKYVELIEEQISTAAISEQGAPLLDPLIEIATKHRNAARSAVETHRVLDHGKASPKMTVGS